MFVDIVFYIVLYPVGIFNISFSNYNNALTHISPDSATKKKVVSTFVNSDFERLQKQHL